MAPPTAPCARAFSDAAAIDKIRDYSDVSLADNAGAMLMVEIDGPAVAMETAIDDIRKAAQSPDLLDFKTAATQQEVDALWATRKALSPALRKVAPKKINEDVVVPVSNIPELITGLDSLAKQ